MAASLRLEINVDLIEWLRNLYLDLSFPITGYKLNVDSGESEAGLNLSLHIDKIA